MATRFAILLHSGSGAPPEALLRVAAHRAGLRPAFKNPAVTAFCDGDVVEFGRVGVVFGTLFSRETRPRRVSKIDAAACRRLQASAGRSLITEYWGAYVALVGDVNRSPPHILRDPTGTMPCIYAETELGTVFASDVDTLAKFGGRSFDVDWPSLVRNLAVPENAGAETCLNGITELLPGHSMVSVARGVQLRPAWTPADHCGPSHGSPHYEQLIEELHSIVHGCVRAWASCYDHIILGMSGGLDSSIIASCLRDSSKSASGLTMFTSDSAGDERIHARLAARAAGLPLLEHRYDTDDVDIALTTGGHLPRPSAPYFFQSIRAAHRVANTQHPIDAFFTGIGGDNVFYASRSGAALVDQYRSQGIGHGLLRTLREISDITECSMWTVANAAIRTSRGRPKRRARQDQFLSADAAAMPSSMMRHDWLETMDPRIPGKVGHITMILRACRNLELYPRASHGPQIAPLLSQPLVEFALGVPSWQWFSGGRDRAIARDAFSRDLPEQLVQRRSKGGPTGFMIDLYAKKKSELRHFLLNGQLVRQNIVDAQEISDHLRSGSPIVEGEYQQILRLGAVEAWIQSWRPQGAT